MTRMLRAALAYAAAGWPVFACRRDAKVPATEHGFKDATIDRPTITAWWTRQPDANIGLATGAPGPDVVDIDCKAAAPGIASMRRLQLAGLLTGACRLVGTPSGGWHLYYRGTEQHNAALPRHGVDFRSTGGYVVAPPSTVDGRAYVEHDARDTAVTVDFGRIRQFLDPPQQTRTYTPSAGDGNWAALAAHVARQAPDSNNRNNALYWAACRAAQEDAPGEAFGALVDAACSVGLPEPEARRTVASARRRFGGDR